MVKNNFREAITFQATVGKGAHIRDCNFTMLSKRKIEIGRRTLAAKKVRQTSSAVITVGERGTKQRLEQILSCNRVCI